MLNFKTATFIKSADCLKNAPNGGFPEVLLVGKSNVGKSSLINALTAKKSLAFTSSKPGHTRLLNYYEIDSALYLVDAPGYGYAAGGVNLDKLFASMMDDYFKNNSHLKLVLVLLDSRRELGDNDIEIINYLENQNIPYLFILTKVDKVNQKEKAALLKHLLSLGIKQEEVLFSSILETRTIEKIRSAINAQIK